MARQIQIAQTGGPEVLQVAEVEPRDPGPGEIRIANRAIGLNFIDIYIRSGLYPAELPSGLGTEGAGVVDAVGEEVEDFAEGDRVAYAMGPLGAYADFITMDADKAIALPEAIDFEAAAGGMLKGLTVQYLIRQTYAIGEDDTILFHAAAGGVGSIACQWAHALGAHVIGTVSNEDKASIAHQNGAWMTIDTTRESVPERVRELTDGAMVPVVYDSVGKDTCRFAGLSVQTWPDGQLRQCLGRGRGREPGRSQQGRLAVRYTAEPGRLCRHPRTLRDDVRRSVRGTRIRRGEDQYRPALRARGRRPGPARIG